MKKGRARERDSVCVRERERTCANEQDSMCKREEEIEKERKGGMCGREREGELYVRESCTHVMSMCVGCRCSLVLCSWVDAFVLRGIW